MSDSTTGLRFGIMCTGTRFPAWQAQAIASLLALDGVSAELLILDGGRTRRFPAAKVRLFGAMFRRLALRQGRLWSLYARVALRRSVAERPVNLSAALSDVPAISCTTTHWGKYSRYFSRSDLDAIRSFDLDFILRFAFGIIRGDILTVARYGVWSFHHGDETKYRGRPAGFWEIVNREPITGSVLQRLTERLDAGIILRRGAFQTILRSWIENRDHVRLGSADWPARVCSEIRSGSAWYVDAEPSATSAPILSWPGAHQLARYFLTAARSSRTDSTRTTREGLQCRG
jgi:hypothetical protein